MFAIALGLMLLAPIEHAQATTHGTPTPQASRRESRTGISDAELTRMLDAYAIEQAQKALALTSSQYTALAPRLRKYQEVRRQHVQARTKLLQRLRELTGKERGAAADETAVRSALDALREHDERAAAEMKHAYAEIDAVLDVRQQARFRLFEQAMDRRRLDLIIRARQGGRTQPR